MEPFSASELDVFKSEPQISCFVSLPLDGTADAFALRCHNTSSDVFRAFNLIKSENPRLSFGGYTLQLDRDTRHDNDGKNIWIMRLRVHVSDWKSYKTPSPLDEKNGLETALNCVNELHRAFLPDPASTFRQSPLYDECPFGVDCYKQGGKRECPYKSHEKTFTPVDNKCQLPFIFFLNTPLTVQGPTIPSFSLTARYGNQPDLLLFPLQHITNKEAVEEFTTWVAIYETLVWIEHSLGGGNNSRNHPAVFQIYVNFGNWETGSGEQNGECHAHIHFSLTTAAIERCESLGDPFTPLIGKFQHKNARHEIVDINEALLIINSKLQTVPALCSSTKPTNPNSVASILESLDDDMTLVAKDKTPNRIF